MGSNKKTRQKKKGSEDVVDERFAAAVSRPQFRKKREEDSKVVLDSRFASVLTDSRFLPQENDKYGRRKKKKVVPKESLEAFYTIEKEEEKTEEEDETFSEEENSRTATSDDDDAEKEEEDAEDPASRIAYLTALSRGEISVSSSSSDEDDSSVSSEEDAASDIDTDAAAPKTMDDPAEEEEAPFTVIPSPHMAVMNMDWKNVRAVDLFAILSSFTSPGSIRRVQIYPSDFGMERMAKEQQLGPVGVWKSTNTEQEDEGSDDDDDDDEKSLNSIDIQNIDFNPNADNSRIDSDFDPEKLRVYEASKLKYYFAVVEFASPDHADVAYREIDGLELEHSSAAIDLRSIAPDELEGVKEGRKLRDEASVVPSTYVPPDFVVNALQQTNVQCTWDKGDGERERKLTGYGGGQADDWNAIADGDDLRTYLASDNSSSEEEGSDKDEDDDGKGAKMRKILGLDSDDNNNSTDKSSSDESSSESDQEHNFNKETSFVPGKKSLEEKIRSKLDKKSDEVDELTPWEKYQQKRKEKRKERRHAVRNNRNETTDQGGDEQPGDDGMYGLDPEFGEAQFDDEDDQINEETSDDFFLDDKHESSKLSKNQKKKKAIKDKRTKVAETGETGKVPSSKAELELLLAGDDEEEEAKDYDIRGLQRMDKNKSKKLRGARKRKEAKLAANTSGTDFKLDTADNRFAAVLDGSDGRFGIDRTDPNFKETPAMRDILANQTKRRRDKKRARVSEKIAPNVSAESGVGGGGALALSSLVKSLKSKVARSEQ